MNSINENVSCVYGNGNREPFANGCLLAASKDEAANSASSFGRSNALYVYEAQKVNHAEKFLDEYRRKIAAHFRRKVRAPSIEEDLIELYEVDNISILNSSPEDGPKFAMPAAKPREIRLGTRDPQKHADYMQRIQAELDAAQKAERKDVS
jgi:hypothetical protein